MNISKSIAKFFLVFLVFSSLSVQGPIFAGSEEAENLIPGVAGENQRQAEQYNELRKRRKWKNMFYSAYFLSSAFLFLGASIFLPNNSIPNEKRVMGAFTGLVAGGAGAYLMYNFLKARLGEYRIFASETEKLLREVQNPV